MLEEVRKVAQQKGVEGRRRWFADDQMVLIVWYSANGRISGFELCYDKDGDEHSLVWRGGRLTHAAVDQGEELPTDNRSPIVVSGRRPPPRRILAEFRKRAEKLEHEIAELVIAQLKNALASRKR